MQLEDVIYKPKLHFVTIGSKIGLGDARGRSNSMLSSLHIALDTIFGHYFIGIAPSYKLNSSNDLYVRKDSGKEIAFKKLYVQQGFPFLTMSRNEKSYKLFLFCGLRLKPKSAYSVCIKSNRSGEYSDFVNIYGVTKRDYKEVRSKNSKFSELYNYCLSSNSISFSDKFNFLKNDFIRCYLDRSSLKNQASLCVMFACLRVNFKSCLKITRSISDSRISGCSSKISDIVNEILEPDFLGPHSYSKRLSSIPSEELSSEVGHLFSFLKEIGFDSFLNSGSLLGSVRNGDFIPHDDDLDIAVYIKGSSMNEIGLKWSEIKKELRKNFRVQNKGRFLAIILRNDVQVDVFPAWEINGTVSIYPYAYEAFKPDHILPLKKGSLGKSVFPIPASPESLLEVNYGPSWRVPKADWSFDWMNARKKFKHVRKFL